MTTITIRPHQLPPEAAKAGGVSLSTWLKLYALASGLCGDITIEQNPDGSYALTGDLQRRTEPRLHSPGCQCRRCMCRRKGLAL